jgi:hypothetical protein
LVTGRPFLPVVLVVHYVLDLSKVQFVLPLSGALIGTNSVIAVLQHHPIVTVVVVASPHLQLGGQCDCDLLTRLRYRRGIDLIECLCGLMLRVDVSLKLSGDLA